MYNGMTTPVGKGKVALQSVKVAAKIENLLCEVTTKQVYSNLEKTNIEPVYTFPLPLGAVLLDLTIKTETKEFKGTVIEKSKAEDQYEDAITDGDTAIMLEQIEPGLYILNVGNLQPEETIEISITYAELFKWRDNSLKFFLPTVIAPRYGDPGSVGIQPHQTPEYNLMIDNSFTLAISVFGELTGASFKSPSHQIDVEKYDGKTEISLKKGEAFMDRDFVLNINMETEEKNYALLDRDIEGYIGLASFYPKFPDVLEKKPRCITIIVDCSGSMGGDSIAQARKALYEILELLRPEDTFNVIRFGSAHEKLFTDPVQANDDNIKKAKNLLEVIDADMGGTEMGQAIIAALKSKFPEGQSKEVLLITDGEIWNWEGTPGRLAKLGVRFFTVGVGSSVSEAFVQTLADATGGACELVSPHEDMAEKIVRHFKRIYFPKAEDVKVLWPSEPDYMFPAHIGSIYDGDTLHVFGRFKEKPDGNVMLRAKLENGEIFSQEMPMREKSFIETKDRLPGTTARIAADSEIKAMSDSKEVAAVGVKYQLMTRHTNYLAIDVRAEGKKAKDLPAIRKTPQMLAAGWGGSGTVMESRKISVHAMQSCESRCEPSPRFAYKDIESKRPDSEIDELIEHIKGVSQRKTEEYPEFLQYSNKKRNQEQRSFFDSAFRIESYFPESFFNKLTSQNKQDMLNRVKDSLHLRIKDYENRISEVFHEEILEHKRYIELEIYSEIERIIDLINKLQFHNNPLPMFNTEKFFKELERYFRISERLLPLPPIKRLCLFGLPNEIAIFLSNLIDDINTEEDVVSSFLYAFLMKPFNAILPRQLKRNIQKLYKNSPQNQDLYKIVTTQIEMLAMMTMI